MIKEKIMIDGSEWEDNYIGLLDNGKNQKIFTNYENFVVSLFQNEKYCQKVLDFLENSKYIINLKKRNGKNLELIKINGKYYDTIRSFTIGNIELKKRLNLIRYEEVDLNYYKELAIKNLASTIQGDDLSLGDKKIIRDIALENLYSNLEKAVKGDSDELFNLASCVRTDLHDWPKNQLISYGFKIENPDFCDVLI